MEDVLAVAPVLMPVAKSIKRVRLSASNTFGMITLKLPKARVLAFKIAPTLLLSFAINITGVLVGVGAGAGVGLGIGVGVGVGTGVGVGVTEPEDLPARSHVARPPYSVKAMPFSVRPSKPT